MNTLKLFFLLGILSLFTQCDEPLPTAEKEEEKLINRTARELYYLDQTKTHEQIEAFKNAFKRAKQDSLLVSLPYAESGVFNDDEALVYSYDVQLREGEQFIVLIEQLHDSSKVLIDLFQKAKEGPKSTRLLKSSDSDSYQLTYQVTDYGYYKITLQPELGLADSFQLKMYTQPIYAFPVSGYGNNDVTSFWAANRGGGKRSHEGIDIFAPKGTPLIAITDGTITSINEEGLGGKQIRLKDERFDNTIYYAHLDQFAVEQGQQVRQGDTVGYVGNTGNAETTEPHLHFGIYKNIAGPIDPYPYVKYTEIPSVEQRNSLKKAVVIHNKTLVHQGPSEGLKHVDRLSKSDTVFILGQHRSWFHVMTPKGSKGFIKTVWVKPSH